MAFVVVKPKKVEKQHNNETEKELNEVIAEDGSFVGYFDLDDDNLSGYSNAVEWCKENGIKFGNEASPSEETIKMLYYLSGSRDMDKRYDFVLLIDKPDWRYRVEEYVRGMRVKIARIKSYVKQNNVAVRNDNVLSLTIDDAFVIQEFTGGWKVVEIHVKRYPKHMQNRMAMLMNSMGDRLMLDDFIFKKDNLDTINQLSFIKNAKLNPEQGEW